MALPDYFDRPGLTLRPATTADVLVLVALINHAFAYQDAAKGAPRVQPADVHDKIDRLPFYVVQAADNRIVACVYYKTFTRTLYFGLLAVADDYRGSGLAPALIGALEEYARGLGLAQIYIEIMSLAPWLEDYYGRLGYVRTGERRDLGPTTLIGLKKSLAA